MRKWINYSNILTKEFLEEEYVKNKKSSNDIAKEIGCGDSTVLNYLKKYGIETTRNCLHKKSTKINLVGQKFGKLTVTGIAPQEKKKITLWYCKCDCDNPDIIIKSTSALRSGKTTSCGCYRGQEKKPSIYGSIPYDHYNYILRSAANANRVWDITIEYVNEIFEKQKGLCAITGDPICFAITTRQRRQGATTASLDRIDSTKGYIEGNVQWVHKRINRLKWNLSENDLFSLCKKIVLHQSRNEQIVIKNSSNKVLVFGGTGFVGKNLIPYLKKMGYQAIGVGSEYDLTIEDNCFLALEKYNPSVVINLAAKVAGIGGNILAPGEFFRDNALMGINTLHASYKFGVKKYIQLASVCGYPANPPIPFKEESLWMGEPEPTNLPYGVAKKSLIVMANAYKRQYGFNTITLIPTNMYGKYDNFDPVTSHIVPALINKIQKAKKALENYITLWGDGTAGRDLCFVEDVCQAIELSIKTDNLTEHMNIGSGNEITILELTKMISNIMNHDVRISFDKTKPNGQQRRLLDCSRAQKLLGWQAQTNLEDGLKKTIEWYIESGLADGRKSDRWQG